MARSKSAKSKGRVSGSRGRSPRKRSAIRTLAKWMLLCAIWGGVGLAGLTVYYAYDLPDVDLLGKFERRPSVTLLTADGTVFATYGELYGRPVWVQDLPDHLSHAVLATEDRRFYSHFGVDPIALARAMWVNLKAGEIRQGGSTITQQLAKNLFLTPERTIRRKVQEALLALWLERKFSKDQILTIYLNRVYLGAGTYGVEAAARRYFGTRARNVGPYEAAMLAGLLKAPSRYNPAANPDLAHARTKRVLAYMVDAGYMSQAESRAALARRRPLRKLASGSGTRYFADWVMELVRSYVTLGDHDLTVSTTLDLDLQRAAERSVAARLDDAGARLGVGQAALVSMTTGGAVRAMTGGRDYQLSQFNRATQALRQPGSAFKLFVYLAGLDRGMRPGTKVSDTPISINGWQPKNYDERFHGKVTLREAFARSINTVAVQVSERAGRRHVIDIAGRLGITSELRAHPSVALGSSEVSLLELTAAYGALANAGNGVWAYGIEEIRDRSDKVLYRRTGSGAGRVLDARSVRDMNDMLGAVIAWGTGKAAKLDRPAAGKSGTSQSFRDAWFAGYTADLVTGVWLGNDDGSPMKGVTGGGLPAQIWQDFMTTAHLGLPARALAVPKPDREVPVAVAGAPRSGILPRMLAGADDDERSLWDKAWALIDRRADK